MKYILLLLLNCCSWQLIAQSVMPEAVDKAMETLQSRTLTAENLRNYEKVAVNKLKDVLDYATIVANEEYDKSMREAALQAAMQNFAKQAKVNCQWLKIEASQNNTCTPQKLLEELLQKKISSTLKYQDIRVVEKLSFKTTDRCVGKLAYEKIGTDSTQTVTLDFELLRRVKQFGSHKQEVWQVFLLGN